MTPTVHDVARRVGSVAGVAAVVACETVDSTNDALRRRVDAGDAVTGTVLIADAQTSGRGRHGRTWHSAGGLGLYLSWLTHPGGPVALLPRWTTSSRGVASSAGSWPTSARPTVDRN